MYKKVIEDFKAKGWQSKPYDGMIQIKNDSPEDLLPFLKLCLKEFKDGATFIDGAFSFLCENQFKELIDITIEQSKKEGWVEVYNSVISYASVQFPQLLKEYLFELSKNRDNRSYYDRWIWRKGGNEEINLLVEHIKSDKDKYEAWENLINICNKTAVLQAYKYFEDACLNKQYGFDWYSKQLGFELKEEKVKQLFMDDTYHIIFDSEYLEEMDKDLVNSPNYSALSKKNHPTWSLDSETYESVVFGGELSSLCQNCGKPLHHLLNIPSNLLSNDKPISFATCISCLGWEEEELFYQHDESGKPLQLNGKDSYCTPEEEYPPLKKTTVKLVKTPPRWKLQDWGLSNGRENLNKVGGTPSWIQEAQYPSCPVCKNTMVFYLQLDSELLLEDGDELLWGSGGVCYVFWCDDCRVSGVHWQCT